MKNRVKALHRCLRDHSTPAKPEGLQPLFDAVGPLVREFPITSELKLRHCYEFTARAYGFNNWKALRDHIIDRDMFYRPAAPIYVHRWFSSYAEARDFHEKNGGYLLYAWNDKLVCGTDYLHILGLDQLAAEWKAIAGDAVRPACASSWQRIKDKAIFNYTI